MSQNKVRLAGGVIVAMLLGAATIAAILPRVPSSNSASVREIRLVARDMAYYLDGATDPNPTLRVRRGERVRIVLRNEDTGMSHDLAIRAWNTTTRLITGRGEATLEFRAPDAAAQEAYACNPHGQMMRGTISVE